MDKYCCNICSKNYASYQSLWIHNKKFHKDGQYSKDNICINKDNICINKDNICINKDNICITNSFIDKNNFDKLQCYFCNTFFKHISNKYIHIKKCKEKYPNVQLIENNSYKCDLCNKEFTNNKSIYEHKKKCN